MGICGEQAITCNSVVSDNGSHGIRMVNEGLVHWWVFGETTKGTGSTTANVDSWRRAQRFGTTTEMASIPHIGGQVSGNTGASYQGMQETAFTLAIQVRKASTIAPLLTMEVWIAWNCGSAEQHCAFQWIGGALG